MYFSSSRGAIPPKSLGNIALEIPKVFSTTVPFENFKNVTNTYTTIDQINGLSPHQEKKYLPATNFHYSYSTFNLNFHVPSRVQAPYFPTLENLDFQNIFEKKNS